jgi:hypothetical protein
MKNKFLCFVVITTIAVQAQNENKKRLILKEDRVDNLITVAQWDERPGNVTVTDNGTVFSTVHPLGSPSSQVLKIIDTKTTAPFPSKSWQKQPGEMATENKFDTPLGIVHDSQNNIWIIDMGLTFGKTRLFSFNSITGNKIFELTFPENVAPKGSFIQDLAVDDINGFVYLADISNPGILVVDVNKKSVRRLEQHKSFLSEDVSMIIDSKLIYFGGQPARVAVNPITLSADKKTLFYGAMNGKSWYSLDTKAVRDNLSDEAIQKTIRKSSDKPISDGVATDEIGNHYFTNINEHGIDVWNSKTKKLTPLIRDQRLDWTDNVALSNDGYIYVTVNQLYKTPAFTGAADSGVTPYFIYKIKRN